MNHRTGLDRSQTLLFPEARDDYVTPENPVRFLDAFVGSLDLPALSFTKVTCADTGCPPYPPAALLKLYLYGYRHRIRSSRRLEAECHRNVKLIWLTGQLTPDFKTIADFRKDNLKPLQAVGRPFTVLCRKLNLCGGERLALDGRKFKAVNARDKNFSEPKLQALRAAADARLAEYSKAWDAADADETASAPPRRAALEQKIAARRQKKEGHAEWLAELQCRGQKQISVTDADTRKMPVSQGTPVGYNAQIAVDAKHKLIAADTVTNEVNDLHQLAEVATQAKENLRITQADVVADTGYYNASEGQRGEAAGLHPLIPKADPSANTKLGLYGKNRFRFEATKNVYGCPAGAARTYRFRSQEKGRGLSYSRARGGASCALKQQGTRNQGNRTIPREDNEPLMEALAERLKAQPEKFAKRKELAEHPFGTIKRWFGYDHFLLKGLGKVRCEWSLLTTAYNLKRVRKLVRFEKLMAAVA